MKISFASENLEIESKKMKRKRKRRKEEMRNGKEDEAKHLRTQGLF